MSPEQREKYWLKISEFLDNEENQKRIVEIFLEELLNGIPDIRDIKIGKSAHYEADETIS